MASLLHLGMINALSIVYSPVSSLKAGDSVVKMSNHPVMDGRRYDTVARVVKIVSVEFLTFDGNPDNWEIVAVRYDDGTLYEYWHDDMVRVPPQNPRVVYND